MKRLIWLLPICIFINCTSAQLVDNWKNPDVDVFESNKVLIVGMTPDMDTRRQFEKRLKKEYEARGIEAVMSIDLEDTFSKTFKTELELKDIENDLLKEGFDSILFTKVAGVENKLNFVKTYSNIENTRRRFRDDYYTHQEIFFDPNYYEEYNVYHTETSLYCICPTKDRELIWKGYIDITDPSSTEETINDYVKLLIAVLEEQLLIYKKNNKSSAG